MRIFNQEEPWTSKVNFVDKNNVLVGYDLSQDCCEHADWFISDISEDRFPPENLNQPTELDGYVFDTNWGIPDVFEHPDLDMGGAIIFRLTNGKDTKWLHLFNIHNGYYCHGFHVNYGDTIIKEGAL